MFLIISQVFTVRAEFIHFRKIESFGLSDTKYLVSFFFIQEFSFFIQKLQSIPLFGIVRGGQDNTAAGAFHGYSQLSGRGRSQINVHYVPAHTHKGTYYHILYHFARDARITAYYNLVTFYSTRFADKGSVCRSKLHDVERIQPLACTAANGSADSRDRFD